VCVRPPVCKTRKLWQNERNFCPYIYTVLKNDYPSFPTRKMVGGGRPLGTWNFGPNWSRLSKNADFQSIFAHSPSAVTPSEQSSIITNRKSTTRFQMSLRWIAYVAPKPLKGLKNAKWPFSIKKCTSLEESLRQSFFVWILLATMLYGTHCPSIRVKISPSTCKFGRNWPISFKNANFQSIFARSASAVTPSKKFN